MAEMHRFVDLPRIRAAEPLLMRMLVVMAAACGPSRAVTTGTETGTTGMLGASTESLGASSMGTTSISAPTSEGLASTSSTSGTSDTESTTQVPIPPDLGTGVSCNPHIPDCPPGQKCTLDFSNGNITAKCVTIANNPAQLDEPCTVQGKLGGGIDNCDAGLYCWDYDIQGHGQCWAVCQGEDYPWTCPENLTCLYAADPLANLCIRPCNPLLQDCPAPGNVCIPQNAALGDGVPFTCWLQKIDELHPGELNSPCGFAAECGAGLVCLGPEASTACVGNEGCCQPVCDTSAPNICPGQGQVCIPWFPEGQATPGQDNVGVCTIPP